MGVWEKALRGRSLVFLIAAYGATHWLMTSLLLACVGGVLACLDAMAEIDRERREERRIEEAARVFMERGRLARAEAERLRDGPTVEVREYEEKGDRAC